LITAKQPLVVFSKPVAQVDNSRTNRFGHWEEFHVILLEPVTKADNSRTSSSSHWGESLQDQRTILQAFAQLL
jgi:hypothetical protein